MNSMQDLKGRHVGRPCIIIGNGPSLTLPLLEKVMESGVFGFGANGFCLSFKQSNYRPEAVCMSNFDAIKKFGQLYPESTLKFYKAGAKDYLSDRIENLFELPFSCDHDKGEHTANFIKDGNFTCNPEYINYCGDTVLLDFAIPIAFYMGFTKFYLCGVDCDYSKGYFTEEYKLSTKTGFKGMINGDYSISTRNLR